MLKNSLLFVIVLLATQWSWAADTNETMNFQCEWDHYQVNVWTNMEDTGVITLRDLEKEMSTTYVTSLHYGSEGVEHWVFEGASGEGNSMLLSLVQSPDEESQVLGHILASQEGEEVRNLLLKCQKLETY